MILKHVWAGNKRWCRHAGLLAAILLSGCTLSPYQNAPISSIPEGSPSNGPHRAPADVPRQHAPPVAIMPGSKPVDNFLDSTAQAVDQLLHDGWALYDQQHYEASMSMAERALRIDRHRSELYQLLSRNYLATLQFQQAEQLARQGLSVGSVNQIQRSELEQLLREIVAAQ